MKDIKDKDIIIGFIVILVLGCIALILLFKRELREDRMQEVYEETAAENTEAFFSSEEEKTNVDISLESSISDQDQLKEEAALSDTQKDETLVQEEVKKSEEKRKKEENKRYTLYSVLGDEKYKKYQMKQRTTQDGQMEELYKYWDSYQLDAVGDIVRLDRIKQISDKLSDTDSFYYYGGTDALGRAEGKGLAIYENNTFYFGEWKEGMRSGKGMWLQIAVYEEENKYANLGVIEHSYNGEWKNDLPNGEGQEHFSYDYDILKEDYLSYSFCIANVLGEFKDGYYNGQMYIMTSDEHGNTTDWMGTCNLGVWEPIIEGNTTDGVWQSYESNEQGDYQYHFIFPMENKGYGVHGLMK